MRRVVKLVVALILVLVIRPFYADTQPARVCPALVQSALQRVERLCAGTGRNQICYGHSVLVAEPRFEIADALLSTPGDVTEIQNISRVQLFPMDVDLEQWGVALMRVQANLPDALPGQNVLFMLFGDVELTPDTSSELVSAETDESPEPVRAFRLRSGIGAPLCDSAPPDGLLIQTPHGVGRVELTLNGVDVNLGSTVFFRAQESGYLTVSTLEGAALVSAEDGESIAVAGSEVQIPLDEDLQASAPPMLPQPYDAEALMSLPLEALDRPVEVHPPLSSEEIEALHQAIEDGDLRSLLPENTPTATERPTSECQDASCSSQPTNTATHSGSTGSGGSGQTSDPLPTNTRPPNSPVPTNPPTSRPTDPPPPTNSPLPPPTDPPPPTAVPPTSAPPPTNCPGQSCNAPGQGGSCPGNSCNAPGQNKRTTATSIVTQSFKSTP